MSTLTKRVEALEARTAAVHSGCGLEYVMVEVRDPQADVDELVKAAWRERGYDEVPPIPRGQKFHTIVVDLTAKWPDEQI